MSQPTLSPDEVAARLCPQPEGGPTLRGPGLRVEAVLQALADAASVADMLRAHPGLEAADVRACLAYAAAAVAGHPLPLIPSAAEAPTLPPAERPISSKETLPPAGEMPALPAELRIRLPGYEILGELGRGGMGVVYKARHVSLNRLVALKMILAGDHAGAAALKRFRREAEAVARLRHPGIVQVYDTGEHEGRPYFSLELVGGGSLADRLTDKPWDGAEAATLVESLARAVQAAHAAGIIHRDLKPENVLLTPEGQAKVTDFGLAKRLEADTAHTRTGDILGTPSYMAPEQAAGRTDAIGPATDVYALGAILYRLLTGRPPFKAETPLDTVLQVIDREPASVRSLNPKVPRDLETVCWKCLQKEPAQRYASAEALADDLRRFLDGEPLRARPLSAGRQLSRWMWRRPGAVLERAITAVILVAVAIVPLAGGDLTGVAMVLTSLLLGAAAIRGRLKPMALGFGVGLLLALVLAAPLLWEPLLATNVREILQRAGLKVTQSELVYLLATLPVLVAILTGAAFRERARTQAVGLVLLLALPLLDFANYLPLLAPATLFGTGFGLMTRLTAWYWRGSWIDAFCGSVVGAIVGGFVGSMLYGMLAALATAGGIFKGSPNVFMFFLFGLLSVGVLAGALVNAARSVVAGRKSDRTIRPT